MLKPTPLKCDRPSDLERRSLFLKARIVEAIAFLLLTCIQTIKTIALKS
ncbi:MAG: hypothetical protein U1V55_03065 [Planktothrix rubescens PR222]